MKWKTITPSCRHMTGCTINVLLSHSWHYLLPSALGPGKSCGLITSKSFWLQDRLICVTAFRSVSLYLWCTLSPPPSTSVLTHRKEGSGNGGGVGAHSVPSFPNPGNGLLALFLKRFFSLLHQKISNPAECFLGSFSKCVI